MSGIGAQNILGDGWAPETMQAYDPGVITGHPLLSGFNSSTGTVYDDLAFSVSDTRNLEEIKQCLYPNSPLSNTAGWVVGNQIGFKSEPALQHALFTVNLSWARLRATAASDPTLTVSDSGVNPLILLRQRLSLTSRATCL